MVTENIDKANNRLEDILSTGIGGSPSNYAVRVRGAIDWLIRAHIEHALANYTRPVDDLAGRLEKLEAWAHEPYDFTHLTEHLKGIDATVRGLVDLFGQISAKVMAPPVVDTLGDRNPGGFPSDEILKRREHGLHPTTVDEQAVAWKSYEQYQAHTFLGRRGQTEISGVKLADVYRIINEMLPNFRNGRDDPDAFCQDLCCRLEKAMGIFPNVRKP